MSVLISAEDLRLLRRAGLLFVYLWSAMEVLFVAGILLPSLNAGEGSLTDSPGILGPGILASIVFAGLLSGATMFLPERPLRESTQWLLAFLGLGLGIVALGTSVAMMVAPPFLRLVGAVFWTLAAVVAVNSVLGALLLFLGFRRFRAALVSPTKTFP